MSQHDTLTLEPCPFCGAQPEQCDVGDHVVTCPSCGVDGPYGAPSGVAGAIQGWNRRAALSATQPAQAAQGEPMSTAKNHHQWLERVSFWAASVAGHPDFESGPIHDAAREIEAEADQLRSILMAQPAAGADVVPEHVALLNEKVQELEARDAFEAQNKCSHGFKRSARGTYVNPPVARDWKWFQLGIQHANKDAS